MVSLVLCGGNGTRLWPISRGNMPKQFLQMFDDHSLYQMTLQRNEQFSEKTIVVSNAEQYFIAKDQAEEIYKEDSLPDFIVESIGRNTAGAIAFGAFMVEENEICFVTPSDHIIENNSSYAQMIADAQNAAKEGKIVVFGIKPTHAETGYGYIKTKKNTQRVSDVVSFQEKPDQQTAQSYLLENEDVNGEYDYFWNSGMFMFKAKTYLKELKKYAPEVYETAYEAYENAKKENIVQLKTQDMQKIPDISIDYAVMEKSDNIKVVKADIKWNDVGSFDSLDTVFPKDYNNNTYHDSLIAYNSKNNFIFGKYKTIALNDVENMIIVDTPTALLVSKKGSSQNIKEIVKMVKERNPDLAKFGRKVFRPWGTFTNLYNHKSFKVKTLVVKPGKRLSLQKHMHRSEHWTVVRGTALVTIDEKEFLLRPNESTYIPIGSIHRLENKGKIELEIVEVQVGEYLQEDDIIRFDDDYGRVTKG